MMLERSLSSYNSVLSPHTLPTKIKSVFFRTTQRDRGMRGRPFDSGVLNHLAKGFDVEYYPFINNGVHHRFDKLDKEKKYKEMFNMLDDEETLGFLLWHMEMTTATEGPYNIVQLDEFHERGYGSCILVKEEMEDE
jgi:hypothetical protein